MEELGMALVSGPGTLGEALRAAEGAAEGKRATPPSDEADDEGPSSEEDETDSDDFDGSSVDLTAVAVAQVLAKEGSPPPLYQDILMPGSDPLMRPRSATPPIPPSLGGNVRQPSAEGPRAAQPRRASAPRDRREAVLPAGAESDGDEGDDQAGREGRRDPERRRPGAGRGSAGRAAAAERLLAAADEEAAVEAAGKRQRRAAHGRAGRGREGARGGASSLAVVSAMHGHYARAVEVARGEQQRRVETQVALADAVQREAEVRSAAARGAAQLTEVRARHRALKREAQRVTSVALASRADAAEWRARAESADRERRAAEAESTRAVTRAAAAEEATVLAQERLLQLSRREEGLREALLASKEEARRVRGSEEEARRSLADAEARLRRAESGQDERMERARARGAESVAAEAREMERELSACRSRLEREREARRREVGEAEERAAQAEQAAAARLGSLRQSLARAVAERDDSRTELAELAAVAGVRPPHGAGGGAGPRDGGSPDAGPDDATLRVQLRQRLEAVEASERRSAADVRRAREELEAERAARARAEAGLRAELDGAEARIERVLARAADAEESRVRARAEAAKARAEAEGARAESRAEAEDRLAEASLSVQQAREEADASRGRAMAAEESAHGLERRLRALSASAVIAARDSPGRHDGSEVASAEPTGPAEQDEELAKAIREAAAARADAEAARAALERAREEVSGLQDRLTAANVAEDEQTSRAGAAEAQAGRLSKQLEAGREAASRARADAAAAEDRAVEAEQRAAEAAADKDKALRASLGLAGAAKAAVESLEHVSETCRAAAASLEPATLPPSGPASATVGRDLAAARATGDEDPAATALRLRLAAARAVEDSDAVAALAPLAGRRHDHAHGSAAQADAEAAAEALRGELAASEGRVSQLEGQLDEAMTQLRAAREDAAAATAAHAEARGAAGKALAASRAEQSRLSSALREATAQRDDALSRLEAARRDASAAAAAAAAAAEAGRSSSSPGSPSLAAVTRAAGGAGSPAGGRSPRRLGSLGGKPPPPPPRQRSEPDALSPRPTAQRFTFAEGARPGSEAVASPSGEHRGPTTMQLADAAAAGSSFGGPRDRSDDRGDVAALSGRSEAGTLGSDASPAGASVGDMTEHDDDSGMDGRSDTGSGRGNSSPLDESTSTSSRAILAGGAQVHGSLEVGASARDLGGSPDTRRVRDRSSDAGSIDVTSRGSAENRVSWEGEAARRPFTPVTTTGSEPATMSGTAPSEPPTPPTASALAGRVRPVVLTEEPAAAGAARPSAGPSPSSSLPDAGSTEGVLLEAQSRLSEAEAARADALATLHDQPNHAFMTLSNAQSITAEMAVIAGAMCLLMGRQPSWGNAQDMLTSGRLPAMADRVSDEHVTSKSLHKVANLVKTRELRKFVKQARNGTLTPPREAELALARWVVAISDLAAARKLLRRARRKSLKEAAAEPTAAAAAETPGAAAAAASPGSSPGRRRLIRRSSSLRRLRRAGAPQILDSVEEKPSVEERESRSVDHRTPRDSARGRRSAGSASTAADRPGAAAAASGPRSVRSRDGPAAEGGVPSPRPVDPAASVERLAEGILATKYHSSSSWFGKKSAPRVVWYHRSPASDALAWDKPGADRGEPKDGHFMRLRDLKRTGFGLLTPHLQKAGDKSKAGLHVVVESTSGDNLELLMHNTEDRDMMLAAIGQLIASRRA